jgi:hypothetical protein
MLSGLTYWRWFGLVFHRYARSLRIWVLHIAHTPLNLVIINLQTYRRECKLHVYSLRLHKLRTVCKTKSDHNGMIHKGPIIRAKPSLQPKTEHQTPR